MRVTGIIPARLHSSRLPRKMLLAETGKPLLQHVWEAAIRAESLDEVIIATDSEEILGAAEAFGARCVMTGEHPSGTDRVAEVARRDCHQAEVIVNIQGDEPELDPATIDRLTAAMTGIARDGGPVPMATLATPIRTEAELNDHSCTKVVCAADGRALYFSRATIPFCRDVDPASLLAEDSPWLLHLGLYAYRRDFLLQLTELPPSPLEKLEKLEQLRALEAGTELHVAIVEHRSVGIDTPEDYARFVARHRAA